MTNQEELLKDDDAVETILRSAPPRPMPSALDIASARSELHAEWQAVYGRRRMRRRIVTFAAAASIIGAIAASVFVLRVPSALPEQVAKIERSTGSIFLLGEQSVLHELPDLNELSTGQTLVTGDGSAIAIAWLAGGSLRIDEDSRVEFVSSDEIVLRNGRVYFDSQPSALHADGVPRSMAEFVIRTTEGLIRHVGTQYMAGVTATGVTVSVREGQVQFVGNAVDATAVAGQQVRLRGNARPSYTNIRAHGEIWQWVEKISPAVIVDQHSAHEFISWVARESGLDVQFADDALEQLAHTTIMNGGSGSLEPRTALQVLLQTTTLQADIEGGSILVTER
jgi:ferric-dicitrate binding protein FerR (iron transport regulator)